MKLVNYESSSEGEDDASANKRIRKVEHTEGNWATMVFIKIEECTQIKDLIKDIQSTLTELYPEMEPLDLIEGCHHMSLSRTVYLKVFQISPFMDQLRTNLSNFGAFSIGLAGFTTLNNDERTRSFLSLSIYNQFKLKVLIGKVNSTLKSFGAEEFYPDPKFHTSLFSIFGKEFKIETMDLMESRFGKRLRNIQVPMIGSILCKIGHEIHTTHL